MDDRSIIALYFARDENAIRATDERYGAFCRRIARNVLGVPEDAEECVNDAYHAAWNRMPPTVPASLKAFLGRITRDLSISRYRAEHAQKRFGGAELLLSELGDCVPSGASAEQGVERGALAEAIGAWLDTLSADDRALFVRRYWYGDAVKTLAGECGLTQNQMAQRMLRLRRGLRAALEKEGFTV